MLNLYVYFIVLPQEIVYNAVGALFHFIAFIGIVVLVNQSDYKKSWFKDSAKSYSLHLAAGVRKFFDNNFHCNIPHSMIVLISVFRISKLFGLRSKCIPFVQRNLNEFEKCHKIFQLLHLCIQKILIEQFTINCVSISRNYIHLVIIWIV